MKPISKCVESDIICDRGGNKAKVLGRLFSLIFRSDYYQYDIAHYRPFTVQEAEREGWKVLTAEGKEPMTKKEVENILGNVEII